MGVPIQSPVFGGGGIDRQRTRERLRRFVKEQGITIRNRHGSNIELDELLDGALGPEPKVSTAAIIVVLSLIPLLVAWIVFVLVFRPG